MGTTEAVAETSGEAPKSHPLGLYILFGTEMWERFSYYGMRAMLVLYLVQYHGWQPKDSSSVYKWYTSLVYLTPLIGGFLADRFLGLRAAVITGGILMAIGHFLMAFEPIPIFYLALAFLIVGNGFFKPNISTMVGKLYAKVDPRRDGAFTIFYMGINLGAGFAPIACGLVRRHYGFHAAFTLAGIGMGFGLLLFLLFQKRLAKDAHAVGNSIARHPHPESAKGAEAAAEEKKEEEAEKREAEAAEVDEEKPRATGIAYWVSTVYPLLLVAAGIFVPIYNVWSYGPALEKAKAAYLENKGIAASPEVIAAMKATLLKGMFMPTAFAIIALVMGFILIKRIRGAARDKSTVIFILFLFVVLFWMAFEQAGNTLNLWAEYFTERNIAEGTYNGVFTLAYSAGGTALAAIFLPAIKDILASKGMLPEKWKKLGMGPELGLAFLAILVPLVVGYSVFGKFSFAKLTEYSAEEWQSANAFLIVILAPLFSTLWLWLAKKGKEPSTPMKMTLAMVFVGLSFVAMVGAAVFENQSRFAVKASAAFPKGFFLENGKRDGAGNQVSKLDAGRLVYDEKKGELVVQGVLADYVVNDALKMADDPAYLKAVDAIAEDSDAITTKGTKKSASIVLTGAPADFAIPATLLKNDEEGKHFPIEWNPETKTLTVGQRIDAPTKLKLIAAGAPSEWRSTLYELRDKSKGGGVAGFWLFLNYLFATIGELCLSPVGLSMVTKLAPLRFASLFMGVWHLASSVAQYIGGSIGELWGDITPEAYFKVFVVSSMIGALILFALVSPIRKLMHNVK